MERASPLTRLHPGTAVLWVAAMSAIAFSTVSIWVSAGQVAFVLGVAAWGRLPLGQLFAVFLLILPLCLGITLIQGFAQPGPALFTLFGAPFSSTGLWLGAAMTARVAVLALSMTLVFTVVHPVRLAIWLHRLGLPFKYAYTTVLALRFLPLILQEFATIKNAQKARAYDIDRVNFLVRWTRIFPLMAPLLVSVMRRAAAISLAMDARAFGAYPDRTFYVVLDPPSTADKLIRLASLAAAAGFVALAIWGVGK